MTAKYYVGRRDGKRFVFASQFTPTKETHGTQYVGVTGPFRTKRAAILTAVTYPNPHLQTVSDAERIATKNTKGPAANGALDIAVV